MLASGIQIGDRNHRCRLAGFGRLLEQFQQADRKSTRLNSSHEWISYAVLCLTKTIALISGLSEDGRTAGTKPTVFSNNAAGDAVNPTSTTLMNFPSMLLLRIDCRMPISNAAP